MNLHSSFRFSFCALRSCVSRKGEKEGEREEEHVAALLLDGPSRVLWEELQPHTLMWALAGYTHQPGVNYWSQGAGALQQAEQKWGHPTNLTEKLSESHTGASLCTSVSWVAGQVGSHYLFTIVHWDRQWEAALQNFPIPLRGNLHFSEISSAVPHDWSLQTKATFTLDMHL